jgi:hypothetical protein
VTCRLKNTFGDLLFAQSVKPWRRQLAEPSDAAIGPYYAGMEIALAVICLAIFVFTLVGSIGWGIWTSIARHRRHRDRRRR